MDPWVEKLYRSCPPLRAEYIRDVLKLDGEKAALVAKINGGIHKDEAQLLARLVAEIDPVVSLEVGLGYGFSAMTICAASARSPERRHIVIDPHQSRYWNNGGMQNLSEAGFGEMVELREDFSFRVLPALERDGRSVDLAFIDGWHTFDHAFVDFFFVDRLLRENGLVIFDDADWPSIRLVIRYAVSNLSYTVAATLPEKKPRDAFDIEHGIEGSCIALRKPAGSPEREIFFHAPFF